MVLHAWITRLINEIRFVGKGRRPMCEGLVMERRQRRENSSSASFQQRAGAGLTPALEHPARRSRVLQLLSQLGSQDSASSWL